MMARQAAKELEEFTNEFKNAARHCFELIDVDKGGSLSKEEIVNAVHPKTGIEKVIKFLKTCGEENLQFLLHPPRLQKALEILDTDKSGEVDADEWRVARRPLHVVRSPSTPSARREEAINRGLSKRVEQLKVEQERRERAAQRADEEFSVEFLNAARAVFRMIDADGSGTLEKAEVVDAVRGPRPS